MSDATLDSENQTNDEGSPRITGVVVLILGACAIVVSRNISFLANWIGIAGVLGIVWGLSKVIAGNSALGKKLVIVAIIAFMLFFIFGGGRYFQ